MSSIVSYYKNIREVKNGKDLPLDLFLQYTKEGKWQDDVLGIRTKKKQKSDIPYVTVSGKFSERKISGLLQHSGFICMDIDDVEDPEMVKSIICPDKHVYAAFTSVSGTGLAVMFKIAPDKHQEAFDGLSEYLFTNYQIVVDPSCRDVSRPRYVSWDPHIYINSQAQKFTQYPKKEKAPTKIPQVVFVQSDFDDVVKQVLSRGIDITGTYQQWLSICFAITAKFGEGGRNYFHQISQFSASYNQRICDRQFTNCLKARKSGINVATFYFYAKQAGIQITSEKTKLISQTAYLANKGKRTKEDTIKLLQDHEGIPAEDSQEIIDQVFDNNIKVESGDSLVEQVRSWLKQEYSIQRNAITRKIEVNGQPMDDLIFNDIFCACKILFDKSNSELLQRILYSNSIPTYNPFTRFYEANKHRRPTGLIRKLFETIKTDTGMDEDNFFPDYAYHFGKKWLLGLIGASLGIHCPLMLVLSGNKQNTGKTEWWRRLLPLQLQDYYAESKLDAGKDDEILMTQKLIVMDDEMGGKSKAESKRLKELTSKAVFSLREPYGRSNVDLKRLAVLCGTSNDNELLNDPTGNRRIIPINILEINQKAYNEIDKTDLIIEAYHLLQAGETWILSQEDIRILNENTGNFEQTSPEFDLLMKHFEVPKDKDPWSKFLTATEIKSIIESKSGQKLNATRLGLELKKIGFQRVPKKTGGVTVRGYIIKEIGALVVGLPAG